MINLGNKKLKTIRKGSERITRIFKGDEKIFEDFEAIYSWKFTVDTTLTTAGTHNNNVKTFTLKRNASWVGNHGDVPIRIDWGDGTEEQTTITATGSKAHTYTNPGVYQITILPTITQWGLLSGWLTGLLAPASTNTAYYQVDAEAAKVVSIDKTFPADSYITEYRTAETAYSRSGFANMFNSLCNLQSYPSGLLDGVEIGPSTSGTLRYTFSNFGKRTGCNPYPLAKKIIDALDFSSKTSMSQMFQGTFANTAAAIPEDIFESVDTSNITNFGQMFSGTFANIENLGTLPEGLFSSINTEKGTSFSSMFQQTFSNTGTTSTTITLPEGIFSFLDTRRGTDFKNMFNDTFSHFGYSSPSITIPEDLFSSLDTSLGTTFGSGSTGDGMFCTTFYEFGYNSTVLNIPEDLFSSISLASATEIRGFFDRTFAFCGYHSTAATIPEKLFHFMDTSSIIRFNYVFAGTFSRYGGGGSQKTVPADIFSTINTTNGVDFSNMFAQTFYANKATNIPATLFSTITTQNATNMSSMFSSTFGGLGTAASRITISPTLFSTITGTNCTNFQSMFAGTFARCYLVEIPSTIFSSITTANGTSFSYMFNGTFEMTKVLQGTIPNTIFTTIDTTNGTTFRQMFMRTFYEVSFAQPSSTTINLSGFFDGIKTPNGAGDFYGMFSMTFANVFRYVQVSIPADLFQYVDLSGATNVEQIFSNTFQPSTKISNIPAGLFGGLNIPSGLSSYSGMFTATFQNDNSTGAVPCTVGDVFSGMTDFSWATANNAATVLSYMFSSYSGDQSSGDINDILQHFNFVPAARTYMFRDRSGMTNYNTINANWK